MKNPHVFCRTLLDQPKKLRGKQIKVLRTYAGMKAKDFAKMIAVTPEHLSRTERNGQFKWSTDKLARLVIAAKIGLPIKQVRKILMRKFGDG